MNIVIDGKKCQAEYGEYILSVARRNNIHIPALCHSEALPGQGNCRLCIVEVIDGKTRKIVASCVYPVTREIEVVTNSPRVQGIRKVIARLLSARAPHNPYIDRLRAEYRMPRESRFKVDEEDCILCGLCVRACESVGMKSISTVNRGTAKKVSTPFDEPSAVCIGCGTCAYVCPVGAIKIEEHGGKRVIWGKTFELLKCSRCGEHSMTREQYEFMKARYDLDGEKHLCPECKKKVAGGSFRDIFCNI